MRVETARRIIAGVVALTLVGGIGQFLLGFVQQQLFQIVLAVGLAIGIPRFVIPACFRFLREHEGYTGSALAFLVVYVVVLSVLTVVLGPDISATVVSLLGSGVAALVAAYLALTFGLEDAVLTDPA